MHSDRVSARGGRVASSAIAGDRGREIEYAGIGPWGCDGTESDVGYPIQGGTLSNFQCRWSDFPGNNNKSYTCTLRVQGVDTGTS